VNSGPTVLFCVGATKAGTSWLHRYLSDHEQCHLRSIKELHYFDALENGTLATQTKRNQIARQDLSDRLGDANPTKAANILRQLGDREHWLDVLARPAPDVAAYHGYLTGGLQDETVVADMTPAYALLSGDRLRAMAAIAPDTRFIYLLRDPVARLWSHVRMMAARRADDGIVRRGRADRIFDRVLKGREEQIAMRSDYRSAIDKLAASVDPGRLLITFYEDLFDGDGLGRICQFLSIRKTPADIGRKIHQGQALAMLDDQRRRARAWLKEQYEFVQAHLGTPPAAWQYEMARVQV